MQHDGLADRAQRAMLAVLLCSATALAAADEASELPDGAALEQAQAEIGNIRFERHNVFDLDNPEENNVLYRLANRLHIITRERILEQQLLFDSGEAYSQRLVDESERLLRQNVYLYDASIRPEHYGDGKVDLVVTTRDLWTLMPGLSVSRKGGENKARVSMSEQNLLGLGTQVKLSYIDDVDRESTSFEYTDRHLGDSWTALQLRLSENSDGDFQQLRVMQPFYALDSRWSAGFEYRDNEAETRFYRLGDEVAEYRQDRRLATVFGGWSEGLRDGWVWRFTAGITSDERHYSRTAEERLPQLLPANRDLLYPWLGVELLEDSFDTSSNRDQIDRTEDFFMGRRLTARIGHASDSLGADRDALLLSAGMSQGFGDIDDSALLLDTSFSGRMEQGSLVNALWHVNSRYYRQLSDKKLFFTTISGSWGRRLDLDNPQQLGGDNGLRGYPLRYQVGDKRALLTVEYRYFTDWYPFRLARVGGAVFADVGRTWGDNPAGGGSLGWLKDLGVGLRLMPTRSSGREVIHLDIAFPLDGDSSIDDVQVLLESKSGF